MARVSLIPKAGAHRAARYREALSAGVVSRRRSRVSPNSSHPIRIIMAYAGRRSWSSCNESSCHGAAACSAYFNGRPFHPVNSCWGSDDAIGVITLDTHAIVLSLVVAGFFKQVWGEPQEDHAAAGNSCGLTAWGVRKALPA
jgi:hypothetical protein